MQAEDFRRSGASSSSAGPRHPPDASPTSVSSEVGEILRDQLACSSSNNSAAEQSACETDGTNGLLQMSANEMESLEFEQEQELARIAAEAGRSSGSSSRSASNPP